MKYCVRAVWLAAAVGCAGSACVGSKGTPGAHEPALLPGNQEEDPPPDPPQEGGHDCLLETLPAQEEVSSFDLVLAYRACEIAADNPTYREKIEVLDLTRVRIHRSTDP